MFKGHHIYYAEDRCPDEDVYTDWKNLKDWKSEYSPNWRSWGYLFWRIRGWEMEIMATFKNLKNHVLSKQNSSYMLFFLSSGNSNKQKSNRNGAGKKREWCPDWSRNVWHLWPVTDICEGLPRHSSTEKNTLENTPWRQELRLIREKLKSEVRVWLSNRKNYPVIKANLPGHGILCDAALTLSLKRSYSS